MTGVAQHIAAREHQGSTVLLRQAPQAQTAVGTLLDLDGGRDRGFEADGGVPRPLTKVTPAAIAPVSSSHTRGPIAARSRVSGVR